LLNSRASFIAKVLSHQPVAPQYFAFNVALNLQGPPLVDRGADLPPRADLAAVKPDAWIVDLRNQTHYSEAHIRGAINVALRGRLDTWTGIVVPFDAPVLLVGSEAEVREGTFRLRRIGFDHLAGWLGDDVDAWRKAGLPVVTSSLIEPKDLYAKMQKGEEPIVIDVRTADEFKEGHIKGAKNIDIMADDFEAQLKKLDKTKPCLIHCQAGGRSMRALKVFEKLGFQNLIHMDDGFGGWEAAGKSVEK